VRVAVPALFAAVQTYIPCSSAVIRLKRRGSSLDHAIVPSVSRLQDPSCPVSCIPPAQPVMHLRVTPYCASVGCVGDRISSYPEARSFDCDRRWISEATQISHPSALPSANSGLPLPSLTAASPMRASGFPSSHIFRLYRRSILDATRGSYPSAVPSDRFRVAPYSDPSVSPTTKLQVALEPRSSGAS